MNSCRANGQHRDAKKDRKSMVIKKKTIMGSKRKKLGHYEKERRKRKKLYRKEKDKGLKKTCKV